MDWSTIGRLASRQHGVVTHGQLVAAGASAGQITRAARDGLLARLHLGVYLVAGSPPTPHRALMAAVLAAGPGAAASHVSAAWLWGIVADPPDFPEVSVGRSRSARLAGVRVHHLRDLEERWVRVRDGIPATDPLHTMLVLGASLQIGRASCRERV